MGPTWPMLRGLGCRGGCAWGECPKSFTGGRQDAKPGDGPALCPSSGTQQPSRLVSRCPIRLHVQGSLHIRSLPRFIYYIFRSSTNPRLYSIECSRVRTESDNPMYVRVQNNSSTNKHNNFCTFHYVVINRLWILNTCIVCYNMYRNHVQNTFQKYI